MSSSKHAQLSFHSPDTSKIQIQLDEEVITLGRSSRCNVVVPLPTVSRLHAVIEVERDHYAIQDANSKNGTYVNGQRVVDGQHLNPGDEIWLGTNDVVLTFSDLDEAQ